MLVLALALGLGSSALLAPEASALVSVSTLTVVDGAVLISHDGAEFGPTRQGDVLVAGDTIRTGTGGAAEITYFDGSSVWVGADTEMVVASLHATDAAAVQTFGRAWHAITKLISGGSRYEERTPSSTASVRG
jgi:hypothetical protein